jgi:hypothetical protein
MTALLYPSLFTLEGFNKYAYFEQSPKKLLYWVGRLCIQASDDYRSSDTDSTKVAEFFLRVTCYGEKQRLRKR